MSTSIIILSLLLVYIEHPKHDKLIYVFLSQHILFTCYAMNFLDSDRSSQIICHTVISSNGRLDCALDFVINCCYAIIMIGHKAKSTT